MNTVTILHHFLSEVTAAGSNAIMWCAVASSETQKCNKWSVNGMVDGENVILCQSAQTVQDCIKMILVK